MGQLLRRILELLGILKSEKESSQDDSASTEEWKARLSALRRDEYEHSKRLADCDVTREQLKKRLEDARAAGEKDFKLERYRHLYDEAQAAFETARRQVDGIRTNVSRLAELVRMRKERLAAGLAVEAEQYHREAKELYTAIQTQQEQLREIEISRSVLAETRDPIPDGRHVSAEEFDVGPGETESDRSPEGE